MLTYLICLTMLVLSAAAKMDFGACKKYPAQYPFNFNSFSAKWYVKYSLDEETMGCITTNYLLQNQTGIVNVTKFKVHITGVDLTSKDIMFKDGEGIWLKPSTAEGVFTVTYNNAWWWDRQKEYVVIATDFYNFALVYTCNTRFWWFQSRHFYILTRSQFATTTDITFGDFDFLVSNVHELKTTNCTGWL